MISSTVTFHVPEVPAPSSSSKCNKRKMRALACPKRLRCASGGQRLTHPAILPSRGRSVARAVEVAEAKSSKKTGETPALHGLGSTFH